MVGKAHIDFKKNNNLLYMKCILLVNCNFYTFLNNLIHIIYFIFDVLLNMNYLNINYYHNLEIFQVLLSSLTAIYSSKYRGICLNYMKSISCNWDHSILNNQCDILWKVIINILKYQSLIKNYMNIFNCLSNIHPYILDKHLLLCIPNSSE